MEQLASEMEESVGSLPVQCEANEQHQPVRMIIVGGGAQNIHDRLGVRIPPMLSVCINTNENHLTASRADIKILVGKNVTHGEDCQYPEVGEKCADQCRDELESAVDGAEVVYILTGLGGGTGSGISPYIARMCKEKGIPSFGIAVMPLSVEGMARRAVAKSALEEMRRHTLLTVAIENDSVARISSDLGLDQWANLIDEAVLKLVSSIHEHVAKPYQHYIDAAMKAGDGNEPLELGRSSGAAASAGTGGQEVA